MKKIYALLSLLLGAQAFAGNAVYQEGALYNVVVSDGNEATVLFNSLNLQPSHDGSAVSKKFMNVTGSVSFACYKATACFFTIDQTSLQDMTACIPKPILLLELSPCTRL